MAQLQRDEVPEELTWDLTSIFATDDDWETAYDALHQGAQALKQFVGHVGDSAQTLQAALEADLDLEKARGAAWVGDVKCATQTTMAQR